MASIAVVTGASSGIGKAVAQRIATFDNISKVLAVSRSISDAEFNHHKIEAVKADVSCIEGRASLVAAVQNICNAGDKKTQLRFLVHAAGIIDPIKPAMDITEEEFEKIMRINVNAPLFLTTALQPFMKPLDDAAPPGRVLNVSSGAAHGAPPVGWLCYGVSKAAAHQVYKCLEREFREQHGGKVLVGSFKPGTVSSPMQDKIREAPETIMPAVGRFKKLKANEFVGGEDLPHRPPKEGLDSPGNVAHFVEFLLLRTSADEFGKRDAEWDIREEANFSRWIPA